MLYALLCYNDEKTTWAWSKAEEDACMARLGAVQDNLARAGKLGPVARLMPTTTATTLRKDQDPPLVIDGPFAETKEQLLGFYIVDCADLDDAVDVARQLGKANPGGAYEIRPLVSLTTKRKPAPAFAKASAGQDREDLSSEAPSGA